MTDNLTVEQRRKNMQAIKSKSKLEDRVAKALWNRGIRYRRNDKSLAGKPDISIKKYKIVIFIDSCFWHCCPIHGNLPKSNIEYWEKKLNRNKERDEEISSFYIKNNWYILRIWEHEIKQNFDLTIEKVISTVNRAKINRI
ncbi:very short patch repair endonuclease [Ornithinibacillus massiliensis]|uniref:Very short patch repair endonuclease n=1 Tax=Ornithinibacillus massiliensis TaxID=1944633 RepID=A0ABS5M9F7_9BACI|nr:very short patch repair endonuclease [Ornithinibacillus massiliensis]MBS3678942.1 very short patch repair endonuclease [Ornithinibacillus massiliensis]